MARTRKKDVMLINNYSADASQQHVEFISYDGRYPNLCSGTLVLSIDGVEHVFGCWYPTRLKPEGAHPKFWCSGGAVEVVGDYKDFIVSEGEWEIDVNELPEELQKYAKEIDEVFNANVPYGCCGGCI